MRSLVGLLVAAALFFVVYHFYLRSMPSTDSGTAPTQAITLTGVRTDLLQIADAEHGYIVTNGHCVSLDELISSHSISMTRTERDGYSYSIECSGGDFTASARGEGGSWLERVPIKWNHLIGKDSLKTKDPIVDDCRLRPAPNIRVSLSTIIGKAGNDHRSARSRINRYG